VVPKGKALESARELAHQIAAFPQLCLQGDRLSAIEQSDLAFEDAMAKEFNHGLAAMQKESIAGATRFTKGAGRHGHFEKPAFSGSLSKT
jgi:enoyl-CoA hydratase